MKKLSFLEVVGVFFVLGFFSAEAVSPAALYLESVVGKTYNFYPSSERDTWLQIYRRVYTRPNEEQIMRQRALAIQRREQHMQWEFRQKMKKRAEEIRRIEEERENASREDT